MNIPPAKLSVYGKHGVAVRLVYLAIAAAWTLGRMVAGRLRPHPGEAVVLCYHGVTRSQADAFAWQISRVAHRAAGVRGSDSLSVQRSWLPYVCVTFDDAFANLLDNALPIARDLDVPVLVFAVAGNAGRPPSWSMPPAHPDAHEPTMTVDQLVQAASQGSCRIGSHTMTHVPLGQCASPTIAEECRLSRQHLEAALGLPIEDLALPYGSCNDDVLLIAHAAGYQRVHTLEPRVHHLGAQGAIGRFSMTPDVWRIEFLLTCAGGYTWLYPWRQVLRRLRSALSPARKEEPSLA